MLVEFLDRILAVHKDSICPIVVSDSAERRVYLRPTGESITVTHPKPPVRLRVDTLQSFDDAIERYSDETSDGDVNCLVVIEEKRVIAVLDDMGYQQSYIEWPLAYSEMWSNLVHLQSMSPIAAINRLRRNYGGEDVDELIAALRHVQFTNRSQATITSDTSRSTMGQSVEREVKGTKTIPDIVKLPVKLWNNNVFDSALYSVECILDVDFDEKLISIVPRADETSRVARLYKEALAEVIESRLPASACCPVIIGRVGGVQ